MSESAQSIKKQGMHCLPFHYAIHEPLPSKHSLKSRAPLVSVNSINMFRRLVARAALGEYFLLDAGNSECFCECDPDTAYAQLDFMQQLAEFFHRKTATSVIQVGRIARQCAQSKSNCLVCMYREINQWNQGKIQKQKIHTRNEVADLFSEQALTRCDQRPGLAYNRSAHCCSLEEQQINSFAHINYLQKIANPLVLKIGADTSISGLISSINQLDPNYQPGRITLVPRLGVQQIHNILPQLINAVKKTKRRVLWSCDPMYGNTETLNSGIKIRKLSAMVEEIKHSFIIHQALGSRLNAIHLEATHQNVSECSDYKSSISYSIADYKKRAAPRLNYAQTVHLMQCIAKHYVAAS